MWRWIAVGLLLVLTAPASAQTKKPAPTRRAPATPALTKVVPEMICPMPLGVGVTTKLAFCDVVTGRSPENGILITLPPHKGPLTLTFDLHNRHTYSEEEVKAQRAYRRYTAT